MPNTPEDGTRKAPSNVGKSAPTGSWGPEPSDPSAVHLAVPPRIGRFEIQAVLGVGSYGRVFLAFDPELHRQVAIKQPHGEGLRPEYRDDFTKEGRATAAMDQHANICPIYEVGSDGGVPYLVMRFVAGGTLKNYLERQTGPVPVRSALGVALKIALGLAAAHAKGIIHRDLKPANVLIDDANNEVLITDFGLARITSRAQAAASLQRGAHGTPLYMPPEQWGSQAFGPISPVADVYSLGVILFEMLAGQTPFSGSQFELMTRHCAEQPRSPSGVRSGLDPRIDAICLKALEKQPANRYRSAREFADAMNDYLRRGDGESHGALPVNVLEGTAPPPPPEPLLWAHPLDDSASQQPKRPGAASGSASTALPEATLDNKEVVRCPKCSSRLEIVAGRTKPIDCPMCALKFAVEAGRQAAARASRASEQAAQVPVIPTAQPVRPRDGRRDERRDAERDERRPRRDERRAARPEDDRREDDGIPPRQWKPAASGLRLVWMGMFWFAVCAFLLVVIAMISVSDAPPPSRSTETTSSFSGISPPQGGAPQPVRPTDPSLVGFHVAYTLLGIGLAIGIMVMGVGRILAARVPKGVRGSLLATLSALAAWLSALCLAIPFVLIHWLMSETPRDYGDTMLTGTAAIAGCAAMLLLFLGEFAYNSYLSAIGRHFRDQFPHWLVATTKGIVWALLAFALFGGVSAGIAGATEESKASTLHSFLVIVIGAAMCLSMVLVPFWGIATLWLNVHAAVVVGRYARSRG